MGTVKKTCEIGGRLLRCGPVKMVGQFWTPLTKHPEAAIWLKLSRRALYGWGDGLSGFREWCETFPNSRRSPSWRRFCGGDWFLQRSHFHTRSGPWSRMLALDSPKMLEITYKLGFPPSHIWIKVSWGFGAFLKVFHFSHVGIAQRYPK